MKIMILLASLFYIFLCGGCGVTTKQENIEKKEQEMLAYIQAKFNEEFEIVEFIPAVRGFNDGMNETVLVVRKSNTNMMINVREQVSKPNQYYDDYIHALASFEGSNLIDYSNINNVKYAKTYVTVLSKSEPLLSNENVIQIRTIICIASELNDEILEQLYEIYLKLQSFEYGSIFLSIGFTDGNSEFEKYVSNFMFYGNKQWNDFGNVYKTLQVNEKNLSKIDFFEKVK